MKNKIGILGGSFDPVHHGHLAAARVAMAVGGLDCVIFVPASLSPFKLEQTQASGIHRLEMLRLATASEPQMHVSDVEVVKAGVSYTIDTVRYFAAKWPEARLFFIMGADALVSLHAWKEAQALVAQCDFITLARSGWALDALPDFDAVTSQRLLGGVIRDFQIDVSSTEIRQRVSIGGSIADAVHPDVVHYIAEHGLYRRAEACTSVSRDGESVDSEAFS